MAVIATGFFDGVHLGHRRVIDTLLRTAHERGERSVVVTFWPHPRTVLQKDAHSLRLLSSLQEKRDMLLALGVDCVEVLDFTPSFSRMTALEYLRDIVSGRLGGTALVLGYDNRLGSDQLSFEGIVPLAASLGLDLVLAEEVDVLSGPAQTGKGFPVSSTKIRAALNGGDVALAHEMLGYRYGLHGVVVEGNRLGRTIGYPTANMQLYEPLKLVPGNGVYLVEALTLGSRHYGMTNIGVRPTVSGNGGRTIETHIFDFDQLIYGLDLRISFISRIREERRFPSLETLKERLAEDEGLCRTELEKIACT